MTSLVFDKDSMLNTTIRDKSGAVYTVSTRLPGASTYLRSAERTLLAHINRKMFLPDTVSFPEVVGRGSVRISKWLKDGTLADGSPASILHLGGEPAFLSSNDDYGLALLSAADTKTILAHWEPMTRSSPRVLTISAGAQEHRIEILTAFLFQEEKLRVGAKRPMDSATAAIGLMKGPGSG
ncbi:hypothetical protein B0H11DRAFT_562039 [Mycena galericulata]|nr:hypothetical protein B0H11DRAFT_562039 [Mycena galericulata]